jgi:putative ABC transport system substrate-binding protein
LRRRDFVVIPFLAGIAASAAKEPKRRFRIGVLSPAGRIDTRVFDQLRQGLRELGYVDRHNITVEYRLAAGDFSRLPAMAAELASRQNARPHRPANAAPTR